jgi:hypothetical protein
MYRVIIGPACSQNSGVVRWEAVPSLPHAWQVDLDGLFGGLIGYNGRRGIVVPYRLLMRAIVII